MSSISSPSTRRQSSTLRITIMSSTYFACSRCSPFRRNLTDNLTTTYFLGGRGWYSFNNGDIFMLHFMAFTNQFRYLWKGNLPERVLSIYNAENIDRKFASGNDIRCNYCAMSYLRSAKQRRYGPSVLFIISLIVKLISTTIQERLHV